MKDKKQKEVTLGTLAKMACEKYADIGKAKEYCLELLQKHRNLKNQILAAEVFRAVAQHIYSSRNQQRELPGTTKRQAAVMDSTIRSYVSGLLDSWPIGNKFLGDCTWDDLQAEVVTMQAQVAGFNRKVSFYQAIQSIMPDHETIVRKALDENKAGQIYKDIYRQPLPPGN